MFPIKLLGIVAVAGAAAGAWASGAIKEKLGGGGSNYKKVNKSKVEIVELPKGKEVVGVKVFTKDAEEE